MTPIFKGSDKHVGFVAPAKYQHKNERKESKDASIAVCVKWRVPETTVHYWDLHHGPRNANIWASFMLGLMATELKSRHATVIYMIQTDIKVPNWSIKANIHTISEYRAEVFFALSVMLQLNGYVMWTAIQSILHFKVYALELQSVQQKREAYGQTRACTSCAVCPKRVTFWFRLHQSK